ncbi:MAG: hypothetical protein KGJ02_03285 [Verrucomicrobiota bacterium]|nr:hypothetical protein [Verrucomicrobiota bacterium]
MIELASARKQKINLADYNNEQDILNRILFSDFTPFDLMVVEEILFSPLKISLKKIARSLQTADETLLPILTKLEKTGLLSREEDAIAVDKEMRKYFEFEMQRFDPRFTPDLDFFQGLLRKVPIHILPAWYSVPRSSNNIFESIVEKHFLTPQIFHRYVMELKTGDPRVFAILNDVINAPQLRVSSSDLIARYNLSRREFEEIMLRLEFHFACCVSYSKEDDHWDEIVTPFNEWKQYLVFLRETDAPPIATPPQAAGDFAFIEELATLLQKLKKTPLPESEKNPLLEKLCLVRLADLKNGTFQAGVSADEWLDMTLENKSLYLYRHTYNRVLGYPHLNTLLEKHLREAEKSIKRVLRSGWVYFDDFIKGVYIPLSEHSVVMLRKTGKQWKYTLPQYTDEEKELIKVTVFEWLRECGFVTTRKMNGKDSFCVTPFGRFFFDD